MPSQSAGAGLGGSDASSVPKAFPRNALHLPDWDGVGSCTPAPWLDPAEAMGEPLFSAQHSPRSPFSQGNTYSADLKEQFGASTERLDDS